MRLKQIKDLTRVTEVLWPMSVEVAGYTLYLSGQRVRCLGVHVFKIKCKSIALLIVYPVIALDVLLSFLVYIFNNRSFLVRFASLLVTYRVYS